jgi:retron-type reverse transcriptase
MVRGKARLGDRYGRIVGIVLAAVYERHFLERPYGFRPEPSAHDAVRALTQAVHRGKVSWILEADIVSFFDSLDRTELLEMLQIRVADGSLLRLVGECLHVGVPDGEEYSEPDRGTTQGSVLSPLPGNGYLHYVFDARFEREVKPYLHGRQR